MSEISPSDGGYYYDAKSLNDLEDEVKADAKRAEAKRQEAEETREKKEGAALRKKDRDIQKSIDSIREDSQDSYVRDRDREREEIGKIRAQNYDRWGRSGGESAAELKQQVDSLKDAYEKQHRDDAKRMDGVETANEKRLERQSQQHAEDRQKAIQEVRDSSSAAFDEHVANEKRAFRDRRSEAGELFNQQEKNRAEEVAEQGRRFQDELRKQQDGFRYSTDRIRRATEEEVKNAEERGLERTQDATKAMQASHDQQNADLREQLSRMMFAEKDVDKVRAQARADAIAEHEDEFRSYQRLLNERNTSETEDLRRHMNEMQKQLGHKVSETSAAKDTYYAGLLEQRVQDNHEKTQDIQNAFALDHQQLENRLKTERERSDATLEKTLNEQDERFSKTLATQAVTSNEELKRQRENDQGSLRRLEGQLEQKTAARTAGDISPAAEENTRQVFLKKYGKETEAEHKRDEELVGSLQRNARDRYLELLAAKDRNETQLHQQATYERDQDRGEFVDSMQEAQADKEAALRGADRSHQTSVENMTRAHANTLERQRRDYEQMISDLRDDALSRQSAIRQDADFSSRMSTRAFSARQNELIRDYEKKLADQKADYDSQIDDLKTSTQNALHEKDRSLHQTLDDQNRNFDQRAAQLEAQHKDRERLITQNYEAELEKVKRSNALLIQKKG